ncbi:hypothetical protein CSOJ01_09063 [Colletotrichum sojae]|uniref:Uncharacterized protein n=1 Tax=Colletotrichum sojae TaxID=2175907 RepID=A0A8H6J3X9_9PEZI|nr:hypothetical protein CSOJ01_09063 [Colletotrichum sojae]
MLGVELALQPHRPDEKCKVLSQFVEKPVWCEEFSLGGRSGGACGCSVVPSGWPATGSSPTATILQHGVSSRAIQDSPQANRPTAAPLRTGDTQPPYRPASWVPESFHANSFFYRVHCRYEADERGEATWPPKIQPPTVAVS